MKVRNALFAGSWYPGSADACEKQIEEFLEEAPPLPDDGKPRVGGIVPHAGWMFSGAIACSVIASLKTGEPPDVIALFGRHLPPGGANSILAEGAWETPFGPVEIETDLAAALIDRFPFQVEPPGRPVQDNTMELQLPFLKYFFPETKLVPMAVPPDTASLAIGRGVVDLAAEAGLRLKVIGSTDLTHYGANYGFEPQGRGREAVDWVRFENDRKIIEAMLALEPETVIRQALENQNACCGGAAATALAAAKALGAVDAESVAYATSYEKNPGDSFVGYVGVVF
jgi:hypothetical protein